MNAQGSFLISHACTRPSQGFLSLQLSLCFFSKLITLLQALPWDVCPRILLPHLGTQQNTTNQIPYFHLHVLQRMLCRFMDDCDYRDTIFMKFEGESQLPYMQIVTFVSLNFVTLNVGSEWWQPAWGWSMWCSRWYRRALPHSEGPRVLSMVGPACGQSPSADQVVIPHYCTQPSVLYEK